jgi:hypothetical protein
MVCFQTQNPNLGKIFRVSDWKMYIYLRPFGIFKDHLAHCVFIFFRFWYHAPRKIWQPWKRWGQVQKFSEEKKSRFFFAALDISTILLTEAYERKKSFFWFALMCKGGCKEMSFDFLVTLSLILSQTESHWVEVKITDITYPKLT